MSKENIICENCGENINSDIYACEECNNQICDMCAHICKTCGVYLCDGCYHDHKVNCK